MAAVVNWADLETVMFGLSKKINSVGFAETPFVNQFKETSKDMYTKHIWFKKIFNTNQDTLAAALTINATQMTVTGATSTNPVKYWPGYMDFRIDSERGSIDSLANTNVYNISRGIGGTSAAAHANGAKIVLIPRNAIGSGKLGKNNTNFAGREYNLLSNYQDELTIANPVHEGRMPSMADANEGSFAEQKIELLFQARLTMEREAFYAERFNAGSAAPSTAGITTTANRGASIAGGVSYFRSQHGGRLVTLSGGVPTLQEIQTTSRIMYRRGAFTRTTDTVRKKEAQGFIFTSDVLFDKLQQLVWPHLTVIDQSMDEFGTTVHRIKVSGVVWDVKISSGVEDGDMFFIPNRPDLIKVKCHRLVEQQPTNYDGDNETNIYTVTWTFEIGQGYILAQHTGYTTS